MLTFVIVGTTIVTLVGDVAAGGAVDFIGEFRSIDDGCSFFDIPEDIPARDRYGVVAIIVEPVVEVRTLTRDLYPDSLMDILGLDIHLPLRQKGNIADIPAADPHSGKLDRLGKGADNDEGGTLRLEPGVHAEGDSHIIDGEAEDLVSLGGVDCIMGGEPVDYRGTDLGGKGVGCIRCKLGRFRLRWWVVVHEVRRLEEVFVFGQILEH